MEIILTRIKYIKKSCELMINATIFFAFVVCIIGINILLHKYGNFVVLFELKKRV